MIDADTETVRTVSAGTCVNGFSKWFGIAAVGSRVYCAPSNASSVLVIDAESESVRTLPCGLAGAGKWSGIVAVGHKLFCSPCNASYVLVIDAQTDEMQQIACGVAGDYKWTGIAPSEKMPRAHLCAPLTFLSIVLCKIYMDMERLLTEPCPYPYAPCYGSGDQALLRTVQCRGCAHDRCGHRDGAGDTMCLWRGER